jgi:hypothetical protein
MPTTYDHAKHTRRRTDIVEDRVALAGKACNSLGVLHGPAMDMARDSGSGTPKNR